uniref:Receptor ligand binding region domain-containing protein n=1 Tax=Aegilops tauschii subsp. strangulata TaxID=200361 RepID=A0A453KW64_AEGTS
MTMQTTVFVVHMSFTMASRVLIKAKDVGMMNKGYAWIMTDGVTNLIDSLNPSVLKSLSGILGVKFYVPKSTKLDDFTTRWNKRFQTDNPTDLPLKLSTFGMWSYDTIWVVAQAAEKVGLKNATFTKPGVTRNSTSLETLKHLVMVQNYYKKSCRINLKASVAILTFQTGSCKFQHFK